MTPEQTTGTPSGAVAPVSTHQRVDTLDVLRGFALLGILVVNIELFRGADVYGLLIGETPQTSPGEDVVQFLAGWLFSGKFISSFALLFGVGAAIIAGRAVAAGRSPRGLLARRYGWLLAFGLAHMLLLFAGDILFVYGLAGMLLLPFVFLSPRALLRWAVGLVALFTVAMLAVTALGMAFEAGSGDMTGGEPFAQLVEERRDAAVAAYTDGDLGDQLRARAWEALLVQSSQVLVVPWILALFVAGFAVGKAGVVGSLEAHRGLLRRVAVVGIGAGLVLNLPMGFAGTLGGAAAGADAPTGEVWLLLVPVAQMAGAPVLAVGYLAALALACRHRRVLAALRPLRDAGRMALSAYVLQSLLATGFFVGLGYYEALSSVQALAVVAGIWAVMLAVCSAWQRWLGRGPLERLWRRLTYGRPAR